MIDDALKTCNLLLIICSPSSLTRPWINFEAGCGWVKGIKMIPICHSGQKKDQLPFPFSLLQGIELEDKKFAQLFLEALAIHFNLGVPTVRKGIFAKEIDKAKRNTYIPDATPEIITSQQERTQLIIDDLQTLLSSEGVDKQTVWTSTCLHK